MSDTFTVFIPKHFPGPVEATFLSRTFSDQGVKMRIRKEHRLQRLVVLEYTYLEYFTNYELFILAERRERVTHQLMLLSQRNTNQRDQTEQSSHHHLMLSLHLRLQIQMYSLVAGKHLLINQNNLPTTMVLLLHQTQKNLFPTTA